MKLIDFKSIALPKLFIDSYNEYIVIVCFKTYSFCPFPEDDCSAKKIHQHYRY